METIQKDHRSIGPQSKFPRGKSPFVSYFWTQEKYGGIMKYSHLISLVILTIVFCLLQISQASQGIVVTTQLQIVLNGIGT
jgi:hypothetical protein